MRVVPALWELGDSFSEHVGAETLSYRRLPIKMWRQKVLLAFKATVALLARLMLSQSLDLQ